MKDSPPLKKQVLWGGEFWSDGKYIGTVGEATSEKVIRKYIRNQSLDKAETEDRTGVEPFLKQQAFNQPQWRVCLGTFSAGADLVMAHQYRFNTGPVDGFCNVHNAH